MVVFFIFEAVHLLWREWRVAHHKTFSTHLRVSMELTPILSHFPIGVSDADHRCWGQKNNYTHQYIRLLWQQVKFAGPVWDLERKMNDNVICSYIFSPAEGSVKSWDNLTLKHELTGQQNPTIHESVKLATLGLEKHKKYPDIPKIAGYYFFKQVHLFTFHLSDLHFDRKRVTAISCFWSNMLICQQNSETCVKPLYAIHLRSAHHLHRHVLLFFISLHNHWMKLGHRTNPSVTSIQTPADAFGWGAFKFRSRAVYEGACQAGLGLGSSTVTELGAQSQKASFRRRFWCI